MNKTPKLRFKEFSGEWEEKKLGEITIKVGSGKTPKGGNSVYTTEGIIFLRSQNVLNGYLSLKDVAYISYEENNKMISTEVYNNDILLNITGASIGRSCVVPNKFPKANVNQHVCIIRINKEYIPNFILNQILSIKVQKQINSYQAGGNREGLNFKQIKNIKISSTNITEQEKIASFLSLIDKKIEKQEEKVQALEQYKKGMMQKIFNQEIRFKDDFGAEYPEWEIKKITDIAKTSIGLVTTMTKNYTDIGVKLIRNSDIKENRIKKHSLINLDKEFASKNENKKLKTLDIVTVHTGDIGTSAIIDNELNGCLGFATLNTRPFFNIINSYYLCHYFNTHINKKYALRMSTGDGRSNYNLNDFNKANILVPCLQEQQKIASFLSAIDKKIEKETEKLTELNQLKKGLLQQMFV